MATSLISFTGPLERQEDHPSHSKNVAFCSGWTSLALSVRDMCGCLAWRSEDAHSWWVDCKDGALPRGLQDGMFHGNFICTTATACVANNEMLQSETNSVRSPRFHSFPICSHLACPSRICSWSIV